MPFALLILLLMTFFVGCKKNGQQADNCFADAPTIRQIVDKQALIKITNPNGGAYLVETGSIDGKLIPCNLPTEYYQNDLLVTISGEVKPRVQSPLEPCCSEDFFITKITR
jgi:hypothetical protein